MEQFDTFPEAFDYVRCKNEPCTVMVVDEKWKLYPSGSAKQIARNLTTHRETQRVKALLARKKE